MKLTQKQKKFADLYITSLNPKESYLNSGYKAKNDETAYANAHRLLKNDKVCTYIDEKLAEKDNERIASQDEVLEFLTKVQRGEVTEQTPLVLGKQFKVIDKEPSIKDRTKAAELLGKRYSLFTDRIEANVSQDIVVEWGGNDRTED